MIEYDRKEFDLIFILLIIAITTGIVAVTYSKFFSSSKSDNDLSVARWVVKVNNRIVTDNNHTFTFDDIIIDKNDNVEEGMFAPGVSATLPITIDAKDSDVAVDYEVNVASDYVPINKAIVIKNVPIKGTIPIGGTVNIDNLKLVWEDIEGNDEEDTNFAINNEIFKIPVEVKLTQHIDK